MDEKKFDQNVKDAETEDSYFESSEKFDDTVSNASDSSFHSLTQDLDNCEVEQSLLRSSSIEDSCCNIKNNNENEVLTPTLDSNSSEEYCEDPSLKKLATTIADLVKAASNEAQKPADFNTVKTKNADLEDTVQTETADLENAVQTEIADDINTVENKEHLEEVLPEEFDFTSLDSVKAKDEEWELAVKDKCVDLEEEEIKSMETGAIEDKRAGNVLFTSASYSEAIEQYNAGLQRCPLTATQDRAMLYHNRAVAYSKMEEPKLAVHSLDHALVIWPEYLKAVVRRAGLHEQLTNFDEALQDYKTVLELSPGHADARKAVQRLPPMIEERNEKLKTEMMGKLQDLGNMFLRPFGLSTNNFQMQQDPSSGGYNIQFNQNAEQ